MGFNPPTLAHAHIAARLAERCDGVWLDPEPATQHKPKFMDETWSARVQMCERMAASHAPLTAKVGVGSLRKDMGQAAGSSAELFLSLRALVGPGGKLCWAVGSDVACGMRFWRDKLDACTVPGETCNELLVFMRDGADEATVRDVLRGLSCDVDLVDMPARLRGTSSHGARRALVAKNGGDCAALMEGSVADYCLAQPELLEVYETQLQEVG